MTSPKQLNFDTSVLIGDGDMLSKSSTTEKIFELEVLPPKAFKGPPGDYKTLAGSNEIDLNSPNIYYSESVKNEPGDILVVEFEGYILNNLLRFSTPDEKAREEISAFINAYIEKGGLNFQARSLLNNLLNFSWMRRNNCVFQTGRKLTFETKAFQHTFELPDNIEFPDLSEIQPDTPDAYDECAGFIEHCLKSGNVPRWFKVTAEVYTGKHLKIFPAQEINMKTKGYESQRPPTTFLKGVSETTGKRTIPLMKDTHIKYALFTYDRFYDDKQGLLPININPSGFVEREGRHYRDLSKSNCIYSYQRKLKDLANELQKVNHPDEISGTAHYVIGNYIKGGVFGEKSE